MKIKHVLKVILFGICLGIALVVLQTVFQIDKDVFMHYYWTAALLIIIGTPLLNVFYLMSYDRKIKQLEKRLRAGDAQAYLNGIENLLRTARGNHLKTVLTLNRAAGYLETKQFDTALQELESIPQERLKDRQIKAAYYINLCECYIKSNQQEKALAVYREHEDTFARYRDSKVYGGNIALLDIIIAEYEGKYEQAKDLLRIAQNTWTEPHFQTAFQELADTMERYNISTEQKGVNANGEK